MDRLIIGGAHGARIYVDEALFPFRGRLMGHMFSPHLPRLHGMAEQLGVRQWFQNPQTMDVRWPHYDISAELRIEAIRLGAVALNRYQTVAMANFILRKPVEPSDFPPVVAAMEWLRQELDGADWP